MMSAIRDNIASITAKNHLRCTRHIINLVAKAMLYGKGISDFARQIMGCSGMNAFNLWRHLGAIGKIHNTVKFIMRSDQRRQQFLAAQNNDGEEGKLFGSVDCLLVKDGGIRWNSSYYMLRRAYKLWEAMNIF